MNTDRLLRGIKRRITQPANQSLMTDEDMLEICDDVIRIEILPHVVGVRQDFLVRRFQEATVADQDTYAIPYRALDQTLRDLKLQLNPDDPNDRRNLRLLTIEEEHTYSSQSSTPGSFYFKGDALVLVPAPSMAGMLIDYWFEMAISELVLVSTVATVVGISGDDVTVDTVPSAITVGDAIDFIRAKPGNSVIDFDKTIQNIAGTTLTFSAGAVPAALGPTIASVLAVGDYIALAGKTPVLPLPDICAAYLETQAAARIMGALSDFEHEKSLLQKAKGELENMLKLLSPRIRGEPTKIVNRNGLLRGRGSPYFTRSVRIT